jgi:hypothetical protein
VGHTVKRCQKPVEDNDKPEIESGARRGGWSSEGQQTGGDSPKQQTGGLRSSNDWQSGKTDTVTQPSGDQEESAEW